MSGPPDNDPTKSRRRGVRTAQKSTPSRRKQRRKRGRDEETRMVTFGLDISHHQDLGLDLAQCRREGIEFIFIKATEGASFIDAEFGANLAEARAAGQLVAAYHYVRSNASRSEEHTSELQSRRDLVCRLLL